MNGFGCWLSAASRISQVGWTLSHQQESAGERERERSHCWPFKSKKTFSRNLKHKEEEERERERIRPCSQTANSPRSRFFDNLPSFVTHVWQRKKCENIIQWRKTPSRLKKRKKKHIPCPVRAHKWCQEYSNYKGHKEWQIGTSRVFFYLLLVFFSLLFSRVWLNSLKCCLSLQIRRVLHYCQLKHRLQAVRPFSRMTLANGGT